MPCQKPLCSTLISSFHLLLTGTNIFQRLSFKILFTAMCSFASLPTFMGKYIHQVWKLYSECSGLNQHGPVYLTQLFLYFVTRFTLFPSMYKGALQKAIPKVVLNNNSRQCSISLNHFITFSQQLAQMINDYSPNSFSGWT